MGKVHGSKKRDLPDAFVLLMQRRGFVPLDSSSEGFHAYRLKAEPKLLLRATASNMAGDSDTVVLEVRGPGVEPFTLRCDTAAAERRLQPIVTRLTGGTAWRD